MFLGVDGDMFGINGDENGPLTYKQIYNKSTEKNLGKHKKKKYLRVEDDIYRDSHDSNVLPKPKSIPGKYRVPAHSGYESENN